MQADILLDALTWSRLLPSVVVVCFPLTRAVIICNFFKQEFIFAEASEWEERPMIFLVVVEFVLATLGPKRPWESDLMLRGYFLPS